MNMTNKKRSGTSGEAPHHQKLLNGTTPEEKSEAEILFNKIGTGKEHAVKVSHRDNNNETTRKFRGMVSVARRNKEKGIICEGNGTGYYIPDISRPEERDAATHFCRSLLSRARKLEQSAYGIAEALGIEL